MPIAQINGTEIFYLAVGTGLPCLVMHGGLGADHTGQHPFLDPLGETLRLIYYDHRGNGRSGRPPRATITYEQLAADADALRTHLGVERVAVMGFSAGAAIGLHYALGYPRQLSHLILVGGHAAWDYGDEIRAAFERRGATPEMLAVLSDPPPADDAEMGRVVRLLLPLYLHHFDAALAERYLGRAIWSASANARYGELLRGYNVVPRLSEIGTPTLIVVGRDDVITPPTQAERLHRGIRGSTLAVLERSGHLPHLDEPEAFFRLVRDWLARAQ